MQEQRSIPRQRTSAAHPGWIETTIQFVNADEEAIGAFVAECIELGAAGSMEAPAAEDAVSGEEEACASCGTSTNVQTYFPESLGIQEVVDLLESRTRKLLGTSRSPDAHARIVRCRRIRPEDWATSWKGSFPPERVSACFWVVPPWQSGPLPGEAISIILEPGLAFGTGKHPTTRHCLEYLEEIAEKGEGFPHSFLDIGCGSGILSIAARRLGATRVMGLDIDPDALSAACRNLELNRLSRKVFLVHGPLECCRSGFELIVANLDAKTLLKSRETLWSLPTKGGLAVLSGMLAEQAPEVRTAFEKMGFRPVAEKTDREEGWTTVLLRKP
jgi:ribosomal protein L11 methyltransferase